MEDPKDRLTPEQYENYLAILKVLQEDTARREAKKRQQPPEPDEEGPAEEDPPPEEGPRLRLIK